jgi:hypothetical protein
MRTCAIIQNAAHPVNPTTAMPRQVQNIRNIPNALKASWKSRRITAPDVF